MNYFKNKVVWITGASSGIGEELAIQLSQLGAQVVLSARNKEALNLVLQKMDQPTRHLVLPLDLEKQGEFPSLFQSILETYGRFDMLFNNGGLSQRSEVHETSTEVDRRIMEINYFGNIALTKTVLPYLRQQQSGHIIVTSSVAGKFGFFLRSAYSASKHALHGYYESLLLEEAKNNIPVTLLCPGKINTPISMSALHGNGEKHNEMDHNQATGMPVSECVSKIIQAVSKKKKEVLIGNREIYAVYIKRFLPTLFWKIIKNEKAT
jgi:dehydrogenase/reductase SDR family member 7B